MSSQQGKNLKFSKLFFYVIWDMHFNVNWYYMDYIMNEKIISYNLIIQPAS